jgi:hypothetical protein
MKGRWLLDRRKGRLDKAQKAERLDSPCPQRISMTPCQNTFNGFKGKSWLVLTITGLIQPPTWKLKT